MSTELNGVHVFKSMVAALSLDPTSRARKLSKPMNVVPKSTSANLQSITE